MDNPFQYQDTIKEEYIYSQYPFPNNDYPMPQHLQHASLPLRQHLAHFQPQPAFFSPRPLDLAYNTGYASSSIPMSNINKPDHVPFGMGPRWPPSFVPPSILRSSPEIHLRPSTSAQTLSSSYSSPSPRLSDNDSNSGGQHLGSELFSQDDRESDQDVDTSKRKELISPGEDPPVKKKKKSKMHCCEICLKKFPRPSGLKTHMNTHSNEKPFPCGFPGCTRSFGVRSNAKRHLRTHGVIPTPSIHPSPSAETPYIVGFCPPMIGDPQQQQSSSAHHHQLHSIEGGEDRPPPMDNNRLRGDNTANHHHQNHIYSSQDHHHHHHQSDGQQQHGEMNNNAPQQPPQRMMKLRWMPPSLNTRTNASSLREVRDSQQMHWMGPGVSDGAAEGEREGFGGAPAVRGSGSVVRCTDGGG